MIETTPNGGRPPKVNFLLYGRHAGRTNFWEEAKSISRESNDNNFLDSGTD
jgi:hypothetical protein